MSLNNSTTVTQQTVVQEQTVPLTNVRDALHAKEAELNNDAAFRIAEIEKSAQRVIENIESQKQEILRDVQFKRQQAELQLQQAELLRREADDRQRRAAELVGAAPERLGVQVKSATFDETHVSASGLQHAADQQSSLHTGPSATPALLAQNRPVTQGATYSTGSTVPGSSNTSTIGQQLHTQQPLVSQQQHQQLNQQPLVSTTQQQHLTQQQPLVGTQQRTMVQQSGLQTPIVQQTPGGISALSNAPLGAAQVADSSLHNAQFNNNTWNNNNLNQANNLGGQHQPLTGYSANNTGSTTQNIKRDIKQDIKNEEYKHGMNNSPSSQQNQNAGFFSSLKNVFMPTPPMPSDIAAQVEAQHAANNSSTTTSSSTRPLHSDDAMLAQKTQNMSLNQQTMPVSQNTQQTVVADNQRQHISSA